MRALRSSEQRSTRVLHEAVLGRPVVSRMQRALGTIRRSRVGGNTGSAVEHLDGKEKRNARACGEVQRNDRRRLVQRHKLRRGSVPQLSEQPLASLRKMRLFREVSLASSSSHHPRLRPCLALVSCSCLHSAALSVPACTPRAHRVAESPRLTLQLGSNHTVPETI